MDLLSYPVPSLAMGTYAIALIVTSTTIFFAVHRYSRALHQMTHGHTLHTNLPHVKAVRATSAALSLPDLYQSAKAILLLQRGTDVWLPYMIPLYTKTIKLGSKLEMEPTESDIGFELLSSQSIDEEHCIIQTQNDIVMIFDRARFNHTLVDQMAVPPAGLPLSTGAVITLGTVEYLYLSTTSIDNGYRANG